MSKPEDKTQVAGNRKAFHDYQIGDRLEAGIVLTGTEVKSLRAGKANIRDAYAAVEANELWLINSHIDEYKQGNIFNHSPRRQRKLLVKRKEIKKLIGVLRNKGLTLIPLNMFFNEAGRVKVELGVATGKKQHEKRDAIKERDWKREQGRLMKGNAKGGE